MLFKSTSAFKKQSVKPKKSGLENPLDSFLGRNSILDDKYEDTVSQKKNITHTAYSRNNMGQKCEGNCGLWVLNEMIKKIYP